MYSSKKSAKKSKARERDSSPDSEDEDPTRPVYFVPEEGIDLEVMIYYIRIILDRGARVKIGTLSTVRQNHQTIAPNILKVSSNRTARDL